MTTISRAMRDALDITRSRDNLKAVIQSVGGQTRLAMILTRHCNRNISKQVIGNWLERGVSREGAVLILTCPNLAPLNHYDDFWTGIQPEEVERIKAEYGIKDAAG